MDAERIRIISQLAGLHDAIMVGPAEVAAMFDCSVNALRSGPQRQRLGVPTPVATTRHLRWVLGDVRAAILGAKRRTQQVCAHSSQGQKHAPAATQDTKANGTPQSGDAWQMRFIDSLVDRRRREQVCRDVLAESRAGAWLSEIATSKGMSSKRIQHLVARAKRLEREALRRSRQPGPERDLLFLLDARTASAVRWQADQIWPSQIPTKAQLVQAMESGAFRRLPSLGPRSFERLIGWAAVTDDWGDLLPHWQATLEKLVSEPEACATCASNSIG